jgi:hypothetical protein
MRMRRSRLQDVVTNFILRNERDIFLKEKVVQSPPVPETSTLMPETQSHDKEVMPPPMPETEPHDKEPTPPPMPETEPHDKEETPPPIQTQPHDKEVPPPSEPQPHGKYLTSPIEHSFSFTNRWVIEKCI